MSWLRLDDGFTKHPKFEGWPVSARWAWLECLEYCARYRTGGRIPADLSLLPRAVTKTLLERAEASGWIDRDGDDLWVHDFDDYSGRRSDDLAEAVETALKSQPNASANQLFRTIGGNRKQVLELISRYRNGTDNGSGEPVPELVTRARSRPVPKELEPAAAAGTTQNAAAADQLDDQLPRIVIRSNEDRLDNLGLDGKDLASRHDPELIHAWLELAATEAKDNPAGYVLAGVRSGRPPSPRARANTSDEPVESPQERRSRFVETSGWRFTTEDLADELAEMGAVDGELVALLERAAELRRAA